MPRTSVEAEMIARYAGETPKPEPPAELTEEQKRYFREILKDLPSGQIRSDSQPCLIELVRQMSFSAQIAEELNSLREMELTGTDKDGRTQRAIYSRLLQNAREQSRIVAVLSTKLRLTPQARIDSVAATRARRAAPQGRRPWQFPFDDDDPGEPEPQPQ